MRGEVVLHVFLDPRSFWNAWAACGKGLQSQRFTALNEMQGREDEEQIDSHEVSDGSYLVEVNKQTLFPKTDTQCNLEGILEFKK